MGIFAKLGRAVEGAADLFEIKARSVAVAFGEIGSALIVASLGAFLGIVMILGLLAALTVALWEPLGAVGALVVSALAAGVLALIALAIGRWLVKRVGSPPPETTVRQKEWSARERLNMRTPPRFSPEPPRVAALPPSARRTTSHAATGATAHGFAPPPPPPAEQRPPNVKVAIARKAYEHPKIAAGTIFAALAILGPKKSLRTLTRGLALAGVAASAARVASEAMRDSDDTPTNPPPPPSGSSVGATPHDHSGRSTHVESSQSRDVSHSAATRGASPGARVDDPTIIA